jgi:glyceraldehyde-3-phosphate dehydrogenase/erythrose-4-phosphate dehydrogenase
MISYEKTGFGEVGRIILKYFSEKWDMKMSTIN